MTKRTRLLLIPVLVLILAPGSCDDRAYTTGPGIGGLSSSDTALGDAKAQLRAVQNHLRKSELELRATGPGNSKARVEAEKKVRGLREEEVLWKLKISELEKESGRQLSRNDSDD